MLWLAAVAVVFALVVVLHRNPVVGALSLVASFFALAVMYVLLEVPFLAALQQSAEPRVWPGSIASRCAPTGWRFWTGPVGDLGRAHADGALGSGQGEEEKDEAREKAREEARKKLEETHRAQASHHHLAAIRVHADLVGIVWTALEPGLGIVGETLSKPEVRHAFYLTGVITVISVIVTSLSPRMRIMAFHDAWQNAATRTAKAPRRILEQYGLRSGK